MGGVGGQGGETYWAPFSCLLPRIQKSGVRQLCLVSDERHVSSGLESHSLFLICVVGTVPPSPLSPLVCWVQIPVGCQSRGLASVDRKFFTPCPASSLLPFISFLLPLLVGHGGMEDFLKVLWGRSFLFCFQTGRKVARMNSCIPIIHLFHGLCLVPFVFSLCLHTCTHNTHA